MANAGPVALNRSLSGAAEYPPAVAGDAAPMVRPGRAPRTRPFSTAHDYTRCDMPIDSGVLPIGATQGHYRIGWFRRRITNLSGTYYGVPLPRVAWALNKVLGSDASLQPDSPIPVSSRTWTWTFRRTFGVDSGRYPTKAHAGHGALPRDRSGRRAGQAHMRSTFGPNLLTAWETPGSFGQTTQTAGGVDSTGADFVGNGPYG